jgi:uncharacterized protein (DUF433 family)
MNGQDRITLDPQVCDRQAFIKGTRVMVSVVLDHLAGGLSRLVGRVLRLTPPVGRFC